MNPFSHFEDQFGHLKLSDNDAALHVFLAGWNSAMMEMMQRVNKMPFGDDTRASFAVYFQSQMVNVDAIEKPAQQEPVACVHIKDGCLVGSHRDQSKPFPDGQYGLWSIGTRPQARKPLTDEEFISMVDSAGLVIDPSLAFEIKEMVEAAHGITGEKK